MFGVTELSLPPLPSVLRSDLRLVEEPVLRLVDLALLQALLDTGRLTPDRFLTPAEQTTWAGFTFAKRRREWLGGRLTAKAAALARAGQEVSASGLAGWQVQSGTDGRPSLIRVGTGAGELAPELSISHSHGLAAALVTGRPCGLDLQKVTATVLRVRERFCTEAEAALLQGLVSPGTREELGLSILWAAKEALRKGRGGLPLTGFLAMRLTGTEKLAEQAWCFRLAVVGGKEYPVVVFLLDDFAGAVSVV